MSIITIEDLEHIIETYQMYSPNENPIICLPKSDFEDLIEIYPEVEHHHHLMPKLSFEDNAVYYISALKLHDIMMKKEMQEFGKKLVNHFWGGIDMTYCGAKMVESQERSCE